MIMLRLRQTLGKHDLQGVALVFEKSTMKTMGEGEGGGEKGEEWGEGEGREEGSNFQQTASNQQETRNKKH